jgi:hypothetical protein
MGEFLRTVRWHAATRVHVRVDLRSQLDGCLQDRIELEAHLAQERQIGPIPGQHHHVIRGRQLAAILGDEHHLAVDQFHTFRTESGHQVGQPRVDGLACPLAQRTALRQRVRLTTTERVAHCSAAQHPGQSGLRVPFCHMGKIKDCRHRRVPTADNDHVLARERRCPVRRRRRVGQRAGRRRVTLTDRR